MPSMKQLQQLYEMQVNIHKEIKMFIILKLDIERNGRHGEPTYDHIKSLLIKMIADWNKGIEIAENWTDLIDN